jgi:hypothetical protein
MQVINLEPMLPLQPEPPFRQSTQECRPPVHFQDYMPIDAITMPTLIESSIEEFQHPLTSTHPLLACKAMRQSNSDTMYLWQAMRQTYWPQFKQDMQNEVNAHMIRGHWKIIRETAVPKGATILPTVWSMKR